MEKIYHISEDNNLDGEIFRPRIPSNKFTDEEYEDKTIARVSFAPTIEQCLMALSMAVEGKILHVYEPANYNDVVFLSNEKIVEMELVPDAYITGEVWAITSVQLKYIRSIEITCAVDTPTILKYGNGKTAEMYTFNWRNA